MSARFRTEHYEMVLKAGDMERCLPRLALHLEEPRVGQSYPNFYAAQLASKFVKVVMSGAGGDELFGGYPWRYYSAVVCKDFEDYIDQYYGFWQRLASNQELQSMFAPIKGDVKNVWTRDIFRDVFRGHDVLPETPEDFISQSLYFEAKTFLHGLFVVEDKLSMAHSLETRVRSWTMIWSNSQCAPSKLKAKQPCQSDHHRERTRNKKENYSARPVMSRFSGRYEQIYPQKHHRGSKTGFLLTRRKLVQGR